MAARGSVTDTGGMLQPGLAPRFSGHPDAAPGSPPRRGADTRTVLEAAGVDAATITALLASGAAAQA